jgi:hypothetical protein
MTPAYGLELARDRAQFRNDVKLAGVGINAGVFER